MTSHSGAAQLETTPAITQDMVNDYARMTAQYNQLGKEREELRLEILDAFNRGAACPIGGPHILHRVTQHRSASSWKDICLNVIDSLGERLRQKALKIVEESLSVTQECYSVIIRPNPDWED